MPCRCDYMEPTEKEERLHRAAVLQVYVRRVFAMDIPEWLWEDEEKEHASDERSETELCAIMGSLSKKKLKTLQDQMLCSSVARDLFTWWEKHQDLFTWWEKHQENDRRHEREDKAQKKEKALRAKALKKLTKAERKALGLE